ncbi:MAG: hypothetical protein H7249_20755 [Chitinophagaceae bacterium]|nr:hypothetical protein [Oligoflexus sp.]
MRSLEVKAAIITTLLFMILMRLVWMDMRSYVIVYAPENHRTIVDGAACQKESWFGPSDGNQGRPGWGSSLMYRLMLKQSCRTGVFSEGSFVRYNQGFLVVTVIACMIFARIVTRSWVIALIVGLALFSRGRLIASSGLISGDHLLMFGVSVWAMFMAHWIRSGSRLILGALFFSILWLMELEFSFIALACVPYVYAVIVRSSYVRSLTPVEDPILFWPKVQAFLELQNFNIASPEQPTGGIFRPLAQTFAIPLRDEKVFARFRADFIWGASILMCALIAMSASKSFWSDRVVWQMTKLRLWAQLWAMPIDRDIILSCIAILCAIFISSFVLPALRGFNLSIVLGLFLTTLTTLLIDHIYLPADETGYWLASQVILWWEPIILSLGVLGAYHLVITLVNRAWKRRKNNSVAIE